jgi:HemY protein
MIILLVFVLMALVMGALFGTLVARDSGYVLVAYDNLSLETSVWFALLALVVLYILIRLILVFLSGFLRSRLGLQVWNQGRLLHKSRARSVKGLLLLEEGSWLEAKKTLVGAASRSETPLANYLGAARAADKLGELSERDNLLRLAHESTPGSRFAVGLVQSRLQLEQKQWEAALATLRVLQTQSQKHAVVLKMLAVCYRQLEDWNALTILIVDLRNQTQNQDGLSTTEIQDLEVLAWSKLLRRAEDELVEQEARAETVLPVFWDGVPKKVSMYSELVLAYVNSLMRHDLQDLAEAVLVKAIKQNWHSGLAGMYGQIKGKDDTKQLQLAQAWLKQHPDDPALLLSLGRISMRSAAWDQAREYLEASLRIEKNSQIYAELGRLCLALGEEARGRDYMTQAIVLAGNLAEVSLPEKPT